MNHPSNIRHARREILAAPVPRSRSAARRSALAVVALFTSVALAAACPAPADDRDWNEVNEAAKAAAADERYAEAQRGFEDALAISEQFPPGDPRILKSLHNLAELLKAKGAWDEALSYFERSLTERENAVQPDAADIARTTERLAAQYHAASKHERSAELYELAAQRFAALDSDADVAASWNNLGIQAMLLLDPERAERAFERAIAVRRESDGGGPGLSMSLENLAEARATRGDLEAAIAGQSEAVARYREYLSPGSVSIARSIEKLGEYQRRAGRLVDAERSLREAVEILESKGDDHPELAQTLVNLGVVLRHRERYDEAESLYRRAIAIQEESLGDAHPDLGATCFNLGRVQELRGDLAGAEPSYRRASEVFERAFPTGAPARGTAFESHARVLEALGREGEARAVRERSAAEAEAAGGSG